MGLVAALVISLVFGYGLVSLADLQYQDPSQGSPGMAAFGVIVLGAIVGLVVLPAVAGVTHRLALRKTELDGGRGCALVGVVVLVGAVAGFVLGALTSPHI